MGPCVAPHPSTMATALLAYDATVKTSQREALTVGGVLGDGTYGSADHVLNAHELITEIALPPPLANERAAYKRAISPQRTRFALGHGGHALRAQCRGSPGLQCKFVVHLPQNLRRQ